MTVSASSKYAFAASGLIGCLGLAISAVPNGQSFTFNEVVLFAGGVAVGASTRGNMWKYWLACATPVVLFVGMRLDWRDPNLSLPSLPGWLLFQAVSVAATTGFFALGFAAGKRAWRPDHIVRGILSDAALPAGLGVVVSIGAFMVAKLFEGQRPVDGIWPQLTVAISCFALGAAASIVGRPEATFARAAALEGGIVIGLTAWASYPELSNLGPPYLAVLAVATSLWMLAGAALGLRWRKRSAPAGS
jgi:hypothetical protein